MPTGTQISFGIGAAPFWYANDHAHFCAFTLIVIASVGGMDVLT